MFPRITTYSGLTVNPLALGPGDIRIEDIAHALACINRFCGHTRDPITVAQHSVHVSELCPEAPLQALLHDASEAYLGDVTKWLKETPMMTPYRQAEQRAMSVIYRVFGCPDGEPPALAEVDCFMVRFEATIGYQGRWATDHPQYQPVTPEERRRVRVWWPWPWRYAERMFLQRFAWLRTEAA